MNCSVRMLRLHDLERTADHLEAHMAESGRDGDAIFTPQEHFDRERFMARREQWWIAPVGDGDWERAWGVFQHDALVGHLDLAGEGIPGQGHRARLGMGLVRAARRQGHGTRLMRAAIDWAREQPGLAWIDLGVFGDNLGAQHLYERFEFQRIGVKRDRFRVQGQSIDDIEMTLRLNGR